MGYQIHSSHVTDDVAWPPKVLWGSTVGYPSDSLASCRTSLACARLATDGQMDRYRHRLKLPLCGAELNNDYRSAMYDRVFFIWVRNGLFAAPENGFVPWTASITGEIYICSSVSQSCSMNQGRNDAQQREVKNANRSRVRGCSFYGGEEFYI